METLKNVHTQEISSLVGFAWSRHVSGNRARDDLQHNFFLQKPFWIARICEIASFWNIVERAKSYNTHPDIDGGVGGFTPACREYSRLRQEAGSTVHGAIPEL